jgi:hypothetical protein
MASKRAAAAAVAASVCKANSGVKRKGDGTEGAAAKRAKAEDAPASAAASSASTGDDSKEQRRQRKKEELRHFDIGKHISTKKLWDAIKTVDLESALRRVAVMEHNRLVANFKRLEHVGRISYRKIEPNELDDACALSVLRKIAAEAGLIPNDGVKHVPYRKTLEIDTVDSSEDEKDKAPARDSRPAAAAAVAADAEVTDTEDDEAGAEAEAGDEDEEDPEMSELFNWLELNLEVESSESPYPELNLVAALGEGNQTLEGLFERASHSAQKRYPAAFNKLLSDAGITMTHKQRKALGDAIKSAQEYEAEYG